MSSDDDSGPRSRTNAHGWVEPRRIPALEYTTKFLSDLQAQKQVLSVGENWTLGKDRLPPGVRWILYPNGDLQHV